MKPDKAFDYFSAYWDGTLDPTLRSQMDRLFDSNPRLREEYEAFTASMAMFESLRDAEVEVPADLHERIVARVDKNQFETKRSPSTGILGWWKQLALGGVAALAIFGAFASLNNRSADPGFGASVVPGAPAELEGIRVEATAAGTQVSLRTTQANTLTVTRVPGGEEVARYEAQPNKRLVVPLKNSEKEAAVLRISRTGDKRSTIVVVPGSVRSTQPTGSGSLVDLAKAMADFHGKAVVVESEREDSSLRWTLNPNAVTNPQTTGSGIAIDLRNELIRIRF